MLHRRVERLERGLRSVDVCFRALTGRAPFHILFYELPESRPFVVLSYQFPGVGDSGVSCGGDVMQFTYRFSSLVFVVW